MSTYIYMCICIYIYICKRVVVKGRFVSFSCFSSILLLLNVV